MEGRKRGRREKRKTIVRAASDQQCQQVSEKEPNSKNQEPGMREAVGGS